MKKISHAVGKSVTCQKWQPKFLYLLKKDGSTDNVAYKKRLSTSNTLYNK